MPIRDLRNFALIGYVQFGIRRTLFTDDFQAQINRLGGNAYIITDGNDLVASVQNLKIENSEELAALYNASIASNALYTVASVEGIDVMVMSFRVSAFPWRFLLVVPRSVIARDLELMKYASVVLGLITLVVTWLVTLIVSRGISRPIIRVSDAMRRFEQGDFSVRCTDEGANEIGYLSASFNRMIIQIDKLVNQVYRLQLMEKEREVRLLQAQIKPHFLYNTLDTIYYLAEENNVPRISKMVLALSNLFRATINDKSSLILVREDLDFAKEYLEIMNVRFGSRLKVELSFDEAVLDYSIPKLSLQPLIENAIQHGLERKSGGWRIDITGREESGLAIVCVRDNGVGMSPEKLKELLQSEPKADEQHAHFGISYVDKRLQLLMGERASMKIETSEGVGTTVTLTLPKISTEERNV